MNEAFLASYLDAGTIRPAILRAGLAYDIDVLGLGSYASVQAMLDDWANVAPALDKFSHAGAPGGRQASTLHLLAPLPRPVAIYCAGGNYRDHMLAMASAQNLPPEPDPHDLGMSPWHFVKTGHTVVGPGAEVACPSEFLDWEAELAVIIGRTGKSIPLDEALDHVAGYAIANDLSARDLILRKGGTDKSPFKYDWIAHKIFDGSCPFGPYIVPAEQVGDPQNLGIQLWVNEKLYQDSNTEQMIFSVAEQIEYISSRVTLYPGDVILTGTPAGTGMETGERLVPGDEVRIKIEKLGELRTRITRAASEA